MPATTDIVFDRVVVDYAMRGGARITWRLHRRFCAPEPHLYTLQVGCTGTPDAEDWQDVGESFTDAFLAVDPEQREFGHSLTPHYRVKLQDADGEIYYSRPASAYGVLPYRDWLIVREMIRKETLLFSKYTGIEGYLLKRKRKGLIPDNCVAVPETGSEPVTDPLTGEIIHSGAISTVGTEFEGGYFAAVPFHFSLSQEKRYEKRDDKGVMGSINPMLQKGRCAAFPQLAHEDVLVDLQSDRRYFVHEVEHVAQYRNIPVVVSCDLKLAESTHVIYDVDIDTETSFGW